MVVSVYEFLNKFPFMPFQEMFSFLTLHTTIIISNIPSPF